MSKKYRPYFSEQELSYLITLAKSAIPPNIPLIQYLESFSLKISHGLVSSQLSPKGTKSAQLASLIDSPTAAQESQTLQEKQQAAYTKQLSQPASLTPEETSLAFAYRISKGLLTPEEEAQINQSMMEKFK